MGESTSIAWCNHTFNPWWGCTRVSPGCEHCYAEAFAKRCGIRWGPRAERKLFGEKHWAEPVKWNRLALRDDVRRRVFCAPMADVFEDRPDLAVERAKLWALIEATPSLDWLLLTKRPENWRRMVPPSWLTEPRPNVWALTTAEDQERADQRIQQLLQIPAVVRGVSYEPALGPVDFSRSLRCGRAALGDDARNAFSPDLYDCARCGHMIGDHAGPNAECLDCVGLDWLIVGGESGPGRRDLNVEWVESVARQCAAAGVPLFVKQDSGGRPGMQGRLSAALWARKEFPTTQEPTR